jgi:hypothetical protein
LHEAERARRDAAAYSREGDVHAARRVIGAARAMLAACPTMDAEVQAALDDLQALYTELAQGPLDVMRAKELRFQSQRRSRSQKDFRVDGPEP